MTPAPDPSHVTTGRGVGLFDLVGWVVCAAVILAGAGLARHGLRDGAIQRIEALVSTEQLARDALGASEEPSVAGIEAAWLDAGVELTYSGDLSVSLGEWVADRRSTPRTIVALLRNAEGDRPMLVAAHRLADGTVHAIAYPARADQVLLGAEVAQLIDRAVEHANEEAATAARLEQLRDGQR
jgi:hypothetical protein